METIKSLSKRISIDHTPPSLRPLMNKEKPKPVCKSKKKTSIQHLQCEPIPSQTDEGNYTPVCQGYHAVRTTGAVVFTVTGKDPLTMSSLEAAAFQYSAYTPEVLVAAAQNSNPYSESFAAYLPKSELSFQGAIEIRTQRWSRRT